MIQNKYCWLLFKNTLIFLIMHIKILKIQKYFLEVIKKNTYSLDLVTLILRDLK